MQKQLVNFGGVEENDKPPIAKTLVMDISMYNNILVRLHNYFLFNT